MEWNGMDGMEGSRKNANSFFSGATAGCSRGSGGALISPSLLKRYRSPRTCFIQSAFCCVDSHLTCLSALLQDHHGWGGRVPEAERGHAQAVSFRATAHGVPEPQRRGDARSAAVRCMRWLFHRILCALIDLCTFRSNVGAACAGSKALPWSTSYGATVT